MSQQLVRHLEEAVAWLGDGGREGAIRGHVGEGVEEGRPGHPHLHQHRGVISIIAELSANICGGPPPGVGPTRHHTQPWWWFGFLVSYSHATAMP